MFAADALPNDGSLVCRDCRCRTTDLETEPPPRPWEPPRSSTLHCECCSRVFAAGHLPTDGTLVCRDCRAATPSDPTLF